jgi:hypothetical protein
MEYLPRDLLPGERVVWAGRPVHSMMLRPNDAFLIPFSLAWGLPALLVGTVISVAVLTIPGSPGIPVLIFGLIWVVLAIHILVARFVIRAITWRDTSYLVTNSRVLVIRGGRRTRTTSAFLSNLPQPVFMESPDGSGSIAFGEFPVIRGWNGRIAFKAFAGEPSITPVLWYVADVRRVHAVVVAAQHPELASVGVGYAEVALSDLWLSPRARARAVRTRMASVPAGAGTAAPLQRFRRVRAVLLLATLAGVGIAVVGATELVRFGTNVTYATVVSCVEPSKSQGTCTVTWTDGAGQHFATLPSGPMSAGEIFPVQVRGDEVTQGIPTWMSVIEITQGVILAIVALMYRGIWSRRKRGQEPPRSLAM